MDGRPIVQKWAHPTTDSDPLFLESRPPVRRKRRFYCKLRLKEVDSRIPSDSEDQTSDSGPDTRQQKRSNRVRKKPGRWNDYALYKDGENVIRKINLSLLFLALRSLYIDSPTETFLYKR